MIGKLLSSPAPLLIGKHYTRNRNFEGVVDEVLAFIAVSYQTSNNELLLNGLHASWSNGINPSYKPLVNTTGTCGSKLQWCKWLYQCVSGWNT